MHAPLTKIEAASLAVAECRRLLADAHRALAEPCTVHEAKRTRDMVRALEICAREAKNTELLDQATEIRLRWERHVGQILLVMPKNEGTRGQLNGRNPSGGIVTEPPENDDTPTLKQLGISKSQSSRWQQLALQPEPVFEAYVATTKGKVEHTATTARVGAGAAWDGKHYWLTPPDLMESLQLEFNFDFDPCPYPRPPGFDGLTVEWGQSNYVNSPFDGITAWVRKAIQENKKGKRVVMVLPVERWLHRLIGAGAIMRNLGDVKWLATEDGSPGKGVGEITAFILEPPPKKS